MKAFRMLGPGQAELADVQRPKISSGQVLVRLAAAGVCHSDVTILSDPSLIGAVPPMTLGHEMAGTIAEVGEAVTGWTPGQPVGVFSISGCGRCRRCRAGMPALCAYGWAALGVTKDGGLAEFAVVEPDQLIDATGLDSKQVAALTDAGITAYGCVARARDQLTPGSVALVIGIGGLGHLAVQILKATTAAQIVAVDVNEAKLGLARTRGADLVLLAGETAAATIMEKFPEGVEASFDFVGAGSTMRLAATVTRAGGLIAAAGIGGGSLAVGSAHGVEVKPETQVVQTASGSREQLAEVFALARSGLLTVEVSEYRLADVATALDDLRDGVVSGRAVVVP